MGKQLDLSAVAQKANDHIWESLQEAAFQDGVPSKDDAKRFVAEAVEMVLTEMQPTEPGLKSVKADDHVSIEIEDLNGRMTKVAIHMEVKNKSEYGQTILCLFG